jgi:hypothetical protein
VLTLGNNASAVAGFIGFKAIENQNKSLLVGEERMGRGKLIYLLTMFFLEGFGIPVKWRLPTRSFSKG